MKIIITLFALLFSTLGFARDTVHTYSIQQALTSPLAIKANIGNSVRFYFGSQKHKPIMHNLGTAHTSNKTNALNKSDYTACQWAFLSAMKSLRNAALERGGNTVIVQGSDTHFICTAGALIARVSLTGTVATLKSSA